MQLQRITIILTLLIAPLSAIAIAGSDDDDVVIKEAEPISTACVSLLGYKDQDCNGAPMRAITFPTFTASLGPCYESRRENDDCR